MKDVTNMTQCDERLNFGSRHLLLVARTMALLIPVAIGAVKVPALQAQATAPPAGASAAALAEDLGKGNISGSWQGTLQAGRSLRLIVQIAKADKGWSAKMLSIDQGAQPINASGVVLDGSTLKFSVDMIGGSYEGKLSADGTTIVGTWTQGGPLPLTFVRATKDTAWEIPAPPPPPKLMAADADPSFDVATIKPNDSGAAQMQGLTVNGRNFRIRNGSLVDMIAFAYNVQSKQIVGAQDWMDRDRYDVDAVPDVDGAPNPTQVKTMLRKLIAERFKLTFHREKRELSAYVLTVGKTGQKLTANTSNGPLPGLGLGPGKGGISLRVMNATMTDFSGFLQSLILDRPVVDQTGITGKYDFTFTFAPDDSLFNGHAPPIPKPAENVEAAPSFFEAIQQQAGLKLTAEKTQVDVLVIDHVEKPTANRRDGVAER
jgi:uncharacterized protein (TIGR03435 family)